MKTTIEITQKSKSLKYNVTKTKEGKDVIIKIRLNDECHNGHQDFAITGEVYPSGKRGDRNCLGAGCVHDDILAIAPEFKQFVDLHLSTYDGVPMYAVANGFYHLVNSSAKTTMEYLRIDQKEFDFIKKAEDELHFQYLIEAIGLPQRWKKEAQAAINELESLTGCEFEVDSPKETYTPLTKAQNKLLNKRLEEGYYTVENINNRLKEANDKARAKKLVELEEERDKAIKKENDEFNVKSEVLRFDLLENFIYYNHTNEGHFNLWDWCDLVTEEQFSNFIRNVDYSKLPKGIKFTIGNKGRKKG